MDKYQIREDVLRRLHSEEDTTYEAVYREIDRMILRQGHTYFGSLQEKSHITST